MKLEFLPDIHEYRCDGQKVAGVTTILKHCGMSGKFEFRNKIHAYRGTACHEGGAIIIAGGRPVLAPLTSPWDTYEDYVQVHREIPGYWDAIRSAKSAIGFSGVVYECRFIVPGKFGGTLDFMALARNKREQIWDLKSGTFPFSTVIQMCGYEDGVRNGYAIHPDHPGLGWIQELVRSGREFDRCGLRIEKNGRFSAHYECPKGRSFNDPIWMNVWKSCLALHTGVPDHEYSERDELGRVFKRSMLADPKWTERQIKERLTGTQYDLCNMALGNVYRIREAYKLL